MPNALINFSFSALLMNFLLNIAYFSLIKIKNTLPICLLSPLPATFSKKWKLFFSTIENKP